MVTFSEHTAGIGYTGRRRRAGDAADFFISVGMLEQVAAVTIPITRNGRARDRISGQNRGNPLE